VSSTVFAAQQPHTSIMPNAPAPFLLDDVAPTDTVVELDFATCPTCHMADTAMTNASLAAGGYWRCGRCGSTWDQTRLATAAAYAAWDSARQRRHTPDGDGRVAVGTPGRGDANA
jgi:hypothetical protein